jgi:copper oxidase (laccase) domain-containing protein
MGGADHPGLGIGEQDRRAVGGQDAQRQAEALGLDTYADPDRFYSYRRATHKGEPDYGRQISLIALPD